MAKTYRVYIITNTVNDMKYVGVTSQSLKERFRQHISHAVYKQSKSLIHQAMREYGVDKFEIHLIEDGIPENHAEDAEIKYVQQYDTYYARGNGYNMTLGGYGTHGYIVTDDARQKISESGIGRKYSDERNEKLRRINTGRYYKPEWRKALSNARIGKFIGEKNSFYGKHHSERTKQKIRETNSGPSVLQIDNSGNIVNEFYNLHDAGVYTSEHLSSAKANTCAGRIRVVCRSTHKPCKAYGYFWRFKERSID